MSTKYCWYSLGPDHFGGEVCQSLHHWETPIADVIAHCRKHYVDKIIIDEYSYVYTGQKFLQAMGVEEGDGEGAKYCREDGCENVLLPYHDWCAEHEDPAG